MYYLLQRIRKVEKYAKVRKVANVFFHHNNFSPLSNFSTLSNFLFCLLLTTLFVLIVINAVSAEWPSSATENLPICTAQNEQHFPALITDGQDGAIVA